MLTGLNVKDTPNNADAVRKKQYYRFALIAVNRMSFAEYKGCSFWKKSDNLIPKNFVLAVIAVENYGRPSQRRWLEEMLAKTNLLFTGKAPDYSLGVGQIKLSTARLVLQQKAVDDSELLKMVLNPCKNIMLVHEYLSLLMRKLGLTKFDKAVVNVMLKEYNGQEEGNPENLTYQEVVWEVFCVYQKFPVSAQDLYDGNHSKYRSPDRTRSESMNFHCR
ncbi:MAG: hypothetical protein EBE86_022930 [Hormoscilla sp. GUM202]|nr:hypothetical protein [Hormoscilla sp. GUM202]